MTLEENMKRDMQMFEAIANLAQRFGVTRWLFPFINEAETLMRDLKRKDRRVWAARICRMWIIDFAHRANFSSFAHQSELSAENPEESDAERRKRMLGVYDQWKDAIDKLANRYLAEYRKGTGHDWQWLSPRDPMTLIRQMILNHSLAINYQKIQDYVFDFQTYEMVENDLQKLEEEYKDRIKGKLKLQEHDQIILDLGGGWCWVMLDRGYCRAEADAMGHCGNAGARHGDRILSLRKFEEELNGERYYSVFLTFILNEDGKLGEMKGRANEKPAERYHPAIIELLKLPIIKGIRGGGYLPENNFSLDHLSEEQRTALLEEKPELGGFMHRLKVQGDSQQLRDDVLAYLREFGGLRPQWQETGLVYSRWNRLYSFIDDLTKDDFTKSLANSFAGYGDDPFEDFSFAVSKDSVENFYDDLPLKYQIVIANHVLKLVEENEGEDEAEYFAPSETSEVIEKLKEHDEENYDHLARAVETGERVGAENEAYDALMSSLRAARRSIDNAKLVFPTYEDDEGNERIMWDDPIEIVLTLEQACALCDREIGYDDDLADIPMTFWPDEWDNKEGVVCSEQPYYGFHGWDKDAAVDDLNDRIEIDGWDDVERKGVKPEFEELPPAEVRSWIEKMYAKIPDGFLRKADLTSDEADEVLVSVAENIWRAYHD